MPPVGHRMRSILIWAALIAVLALPLFISLTSPLLAWRESIYIIAGFAGVLGLALLLLQPLFAGRYLPGFEAVGGAKAHQWGGALLVAVVIIHVVGLYITSPPDVVDALLLRSPTPFSLWGVISLWAILATAVFAVFRLRLRNIIWRFIHASLAVIIVASTIAHALLIDGTMGLISKVMLCVLVVAASYKALRDRRMFYLIRKWRGG